LEKARQYFQQAVEKDPLYAPAYAGLADYYSVLPFYTSALPDEVFPKPKLPFPRLWSLMTHLERHTHLWLTFVPTTTGIGLMPNVNFSVP